jgi:hypothetical protein
MFPTTMLFFWFAAALALVVIAPSAGAAGSPQPVRIMSKAQKPDGATDLSARRRYRRGGGGGFGYGVHDNSGPRSSG